MYCAVLYLLYAGTLVVDGLIGVDWKLDGFFLFFLFFFFLLVELIVG